MRLCSVPRSNQSCGKIPLSPSSRRKKTAVDGRIAGAEDCLATRWFAQPSHIQPRRGGIIMFSDRRRFFPCLVFLATPVVLPAQTAVRGGCSEVPREDALPS